MASSSTEFKCTKWADCTCASSSGNCGCGDSCGCGSVSTADVNIAMETLCPKSDCACGIACRCPKGTCDSCGGSVEKTPAEWIDAVKAAGTGCACAKVEKECPCPSDCTK